MYKYKIHLHIWAILPAALLASVLDTQHCTYPPAQIAEDHCKKKKNLGNLDKKRIARCHI